MKQTLRRTSASPNIVGLGRAAAYVRVSTEEQADGHSLDSQEEACRVYAEQAGHVSFEVFRDAGFSAKTSDRPAFLQLVQRAEDGEFDTVLVYRLDRFARNRLDSLIHKKRLRDAGVRLISVTETFDDGPSGLIAEGMLELVAEWYSLDLKHKVTQGKRKRVDKGLPNAMLPFGYRQDGDPRVDPPLIVPDEGEAVRVAYERYATGMVTYLQIADEFNADGFRTRHRPRKNMPDDGPRLWTGDSVRKLIQNPFYRGAVTYKGEEMGQGRHQPIVDEELWHRANRVRTTLRGRSTRNPVRVYPLAGIVKCAGCGSNLQGNHSQVGNKYRYYRETAYRRGVPCAKPQIAMRADRLEAAVDEIVGRLSTPADVRNRVLELLGEARDVEKGRARLQERLRRISLLYADLAMSEPEYHAERSRIEGELAMLDAPETDARLAAAELDVLQLAWNKATPQEKRSLALALFEAIYVDLEVMEISSYVLRPAFRPWVDNFDGVFEASEAP